MQFSASELVEIGQANDQGLIPRSRGRKRSRSQLWKMHRVGRQNAAGERIRLRVVVEGRTVFTTAAWIDDYFRAFEVGAGVEAEPTQRERRRRAHANTHATPQMSPDAVATLRRHGLSQAAGIDRAEQVAGGGA